MSELHDPLSPQHVDESIDQFTASSQINNAFHEQQADASPDVYLMRDLQRLYSLERKQYRQALQRVEDRLMEQSLAREGQDTIISLTLPPQQQLSQPWNTRHRRRDTMKNRQSFASALASFGGRVSLVAVILILIGSIVFVLHYVHQSSTLAGHEPTPAHQHDRATPVAPTPTPAPLGKTFYTSPSSATGFNGLAWSPDSKRVAISSDQVVQIQDAFDSQHQVSIHMQGNPGEWSTGVDWSPNSQQVAIATNKQILIVDGQSGQIVHTHLANPIAVTQPVSSGTSYLSSQFPDSGGYGYHAAVWSPDGQLIAAALSFGASGEVQIWNPKTDAINLTIQDGGTYNVGALSWSSDGQYLAASEWNTQGAVGPNQPNIVIVVWQVSTHKVVFQHQDFGSSGEPVVWQPQSHNLAFSGESVSGGAMAEVLEVWDVLANKRVKQYTGIDSGAVAWSPDGRYLAYGGYSKQSLTQEVIIVDVTTDKQIYAYQGYRYNINIIAWSPDGKYIASSGGDTQGNATPTNTPPNMNMATVTKVWFVGSLAQR